MGIPGSDGGSLLTASYASEATTGRRVRPPCRSDLYLKRSENSSGSRRAIPRQALGPVTLVIPTAHTETMIARQCRLRHLRSYGWSVVGAGLALPLRLPG